MTIESETTCRIDKFYLPRKTQITAKLLEYLQQLHYAVEVHSSGLTALQRLQEPDTPGMALLELFTSSFDRP